MREFERETEKRIRRERKGEKSGKEKKVFHDEKLLLKL